MRYVKRGSLILICLVMAPIALAFAGAYRATLKVHSWTGEKSIKIEYLVYKMEGFDAKMADLVDKIEREWLNV